MPDGEGWRGGVGVNLRGRFHVSLCCCWHDNVAHAPNNILGLMGRMSCVITLNTTDKKKIIIIKCNRSIFSVLHLIQLCIKTWQIIVKKCNTRFNVAFHRWLNTHVHRHVHTCVSERLFNVCPGCVFLHRGASAGTSYGCSFKCDIWTSQFITEWAAVFHTATFCRVFARARVHWGTLSSPFPTHKPSPLIL